MFQGIRLLFILVSCFYNSLFFYLFFHFPFLGKLPKVLPEGPQSSGTAERFEMQEWQVASLSAQALFIFTVVLLFPMAALVGSGSLVILK